MYVPRAVLDRLDAQYISAERIRRGGNGYTFQDLGLLSGMICVSQYDPLQEQVQAVLHEAFHYHPAFRGYRGGRRRDARVEARIESLAQGAYLCAPIREKAVRAIVKGTLLQRELDARVRARRDK